MNSLGQKAINETLDRLTISGDSQQLPSIYWRVSDSHPCQFQPLDQRIAYLMEKFWNLELNTLVKALGEIEGNPWANREFVEWADKAMKTAYTIGKLTLTEFPKFMENAKEHPEDFDGIPTEEEVLTEHDSYQRVTTLTCFHFYQLLRGRISYDRENCSVLIPQENLMKSLFYTNNTIQNEWRELCNLYCREVKQFFGELKVDTRPCVQEDSDSETFRLNDANPLIHAINLKFRDILSPKKPALEKNEDESHPVTSDSIDDYSPVSGVFSGSHGKFQINRETYPVVGADAIESVLRRLEGKDVKKYIFSAGYNGKEGTHQPYFGEIPQLTTLYNASFKHFNGLLNKMPLVFHQSQEEEDITTLDQNESKKAEQARINAFLLTAYDHWKTPEVMAAADELMQLAYAISCLTLEDLNPFTEELKKLDHHREVAEALIRQDSYLYRAFFFCTTVYHTVRGGIGSFNGKLIYPSSAAGTGNDIPPFHSTPYYEEGTVQSRWRELYNDFCYRVGKFVDLKALRENDDRFTKWIQPDIPQEKFIIHPCTQPT